LESSPDIQRSERFETDSHVFLASSPDIQLDLESYSQDETPIVPLSDRPVDSLSSSVHPSSDIQRFIDSETIAEHKDAISQSSPNIQLEVESRSSVDGLRSELSDLSGRSASEAIAQPSNKLPIAIPPTELFSEAIAQPSSELPIAIPSTESSSQAIGKTWDASSAYDSTPNGRRDAQIAASENHLPVESSISPVLLNPLSSDIQRFADDSSEHSSSPAQPGSSEQPGVVNSASFQRSADLPQLPTFLKDLTVLKPLVQRSPLAVTPKNITPASAHADTLNVLSVESFPDAIAQTFSEPAIEFSSLPVEPLPIEPPSQATSNTWNAAASYDSTPNGRRDAQIAASENHSSADSVSPQVLSNSLSSNIQRFIDDSSEHSSFSTQSGSSDQLEAVSQPSQLSADLPQLPRFLKDLTVLKPLVQRFQVPRKGSPLHEPSEELPDQRPDEPADNSTPLSFQNSSSPFSSPSSRSHNSAIAPPPFANIQPVSIPAPTPSPTIPAHPGTAPSAWSSLAELINPNPAQPQQSATNQYSPLAPSLLQAKFTTPTLQRAIDSNAPIEVPNAPTTTLSASDFQQEAPLDALLETLAQEIYGLLRQKMEIERERQGRSLGRMPW
ncbi:MAG: hypothetical protein LH660_15815, partial [Phormidesmis sp. CAN_BIN36]|nr:hypothetical protein [Phormidesmis sp. CAN_BIN36]